MKFFLENFPVKSFSYLNGKVSKHYLGLGILSLVEIITTQRKMTKRVFL